MPALLFGGLSVDGLCMFLIVEEKFLHLGVLFFQPHFANSLSMGDRHMPFVTEMTGRGLNPNP